MNRLLLAFLMISNCVSAQYQPSSVGFKTISDMSAQKGTAWMVATVLGKDSVNDRKSATYYYNDTSNATADGVYVVAVTNVTTGRWMRVANRYFSCKKSINLMTTGATLIDVTGPPGLGRVVVTDVTVNPTLLTGVQILAGLSSVGTNSTAYNNLASTLSLGGLSVNTGLAFAVLQAKPLLSSGTSIFFNVTTIPTGLTAATADVYVNGYYTL